MSRFKKRPSPAMVVALLALVAGLGGSAIAGVATKATLDKGEKKQVRKIARGVTKKLAYTKRAADARFYSKQAANNRFYTKQDADARFLSGSELLTSTSEGTTLIPGFDNFDVILTHDVNLPSSGRLLIWANLTAEDGNTGNAGVETRLELDGTEIGVDQHGFVENAAAFYSDSTAPATIVNVDPGEHQIGLRVFNDGSPIAIEDRSISTLFIPSA
jgi:hypothetical protein